MTAWHGERLPSARFCLVVKLHQGGRAPAVGQNVSNIRDPVESSREPQGLLETRERLHRGLTIHPIAISKIDIEGRSGDRGCFPAVTMHFCRFQLGVSILGWKRVVQALTVIGNKCVEKDQCLYPFQ